MEQFWMDIANTLNNRQIATGIWLFLVVLVVLLIKQIRPSLFGVLRAAANRKLVIFFGSFALWVGLLAWGFKLLGLWRYDQILATLFWIAITGFPLLGRSLDATEDDRYWSKILRDNFRILGLFEFLVVGYSFPLFVELVLVPVLALLGVLIAMGQTDTSYRPMQNILEVVLGLFVLFVLYLAIRDIFYHPEGFWTFETGRNLVLPILFSLGSSPVIYLWFCYSHFESARIRINLSTYHSEELKAYARKRFFLVFMLRPWLLNRATRQFHTNAMELGDIDLIIQYICKYEREAKDPPLVDQAEGWSPYLAREFLKSEGLRTNDFHDSGFDGEWVGESPCIDLDEGLFTNQVIFYLKGRDGVVERLKLSGRFRHEVDTEEVHGRLGEIELLLVQKALNLTRDEALNNLPDRNEYSLQSGSTLIERCIEHYPNGQGYETVFTLSRGQNTG